MEGTEATTAGEVTTTATSTEAPPPPAETADASATVVDGQATDDQAADVAAVEADGKSKSDPEFDRRFSALTKREKEILSERERLKADRDAIAKDAENVALLKEDPIKALRSAGWSEKEIIDAILNDGKVPAEREAQILRERLASRDEADRKRTEEAHQAAIDRHKTDIRQHIEANTADYELIKAYGAEEAVFTLIEQHFAETGEIMPIAEAAKTIEGEYDKLLDERVLKAEKVQRRFAPQQQGQPQQNTGAPPAENTKPTPTTLTNRATSAAAPPVQPDRYLSDEESKRHAAEVIRQLRQKAS